MEQRMNTIEYDESQNDNRNNKEFLYSMYKHTRTGHIRLLSWMTFAGDESVHRTWLRPMNACNDLS